MGNTSSHFHTACLRDDVTAVKAQMSAGKHDGAAALRAASRAGAAGVVEVLLETEPEWVNTPHPTTGDTALLAACASGHTHCVPLLLSGGADCSIHNSSGASPLLISAKLGHLSILSLLLENGCSLHQSDKATRSALRLASGMGHTQCVRALLIHGAEDGGATTGLFIAAKRGDVEMVKEYVAAGVDVNVQRDGDGLTPLLVAIMKQQAGSVDVLLEAGADMQRAGHNGQTPLYKAISVGSTECVRLLIAAGVDVEADVHKRHAGESPVELAARLGRTACLAELNQCGGAERASIGVLSERNGHSAYMG